jgi:hypothetical protein
MVRAMSMQELDCIRYCGADPNVARKLIAAGAEDDCDRQDFVAQLRASERPRPVRRWWEALFGR